MNAKQIRLRKLLIQELAPLIQKFFPVNVKNGLVSLTDVALTPDASIAKVYISLYKSQNASDTWTQIQAQNKIMRKALATKIRHKVRSIPLLLFMQDKGGAHAEHIQKILTQIQATPDTKPRGNKSLIKKKE